MDDDYRYDKSAPTDVTGALTIRPGLAIRDWWVIERAEHDGRTWFEHTGPNVFAMMTSARVSDADVEGRSSEMLELAAAIEARASYTDARRCAVRVDGADALLWSPRNSTHPARVPLAAADALAAEIRAKLGEAE